MTLGQQEHPPFVLHEKKESEQCLHTLTDKIEEMSLFSSLNSSTLKGSSFNVLKDLKMIKHN